MKLGDVFLLMGILILVYLLVFYWKGTSEVTKAGGGVLIGTIKALQARG